MGMLLVAGPPPHARAVGAVGTMPWAQSTSRLGLVSPVFPLRPRAKKGTENGLVSRS